MSDYEPGTVAVATVRGVEGVRVFRDHGCWAGANGYRPDSDVTDVRPLVVLDLGLVDGADLARVVRAEYDDWAFLADQIEAQTKPPRIPEPGWGAVVEANTLINETRRRWVNAGGGSTQWHDDGRGTAIWDVLIDPVLIREGIES